MLGIRHLSLPALQSKKVKKRMETPLKSHLMAPAARSL